MLQRTQKCLESNLGSRRFVSTLVRQLPLWQEFLHRWSARHASRRRAIREIKDQISMAILETRNEKEYSIPNDRRYVDRWAQLVPKENREGLFAQYLDPQAKYGPSYDWLLEDARKRGLEGDDRLEHVCKWGEWLYSVRPLWPLDLPTTPNWDVKTRLQEEVHWERNDEDLEVPWLADGVGIVWRLRLNDFPDHFLYTLFVGDREVGHFNDWPETWIRSGEKRAKPRPKIATPKLVYTGSLTERYQAGDCEGVWADLVALGPGVRTEPHYTEAQAVARETMRRALHNMQVLIGRLRKLNYDFALQLPSPELPNPAGSEGHFPPPHNTAELLARLEEIAGPIPISLRVWWEKVGGVRFMGLHPKLNPVDPEPLGVEGDEVDEQRLADPLEVAGLEDVLRQVQSGHGPWQIRLSPDDEFKALIPQSDEEAGYMVQLPNPSADVPLLNEWHNTTFVGYLRHCFRWGGFPGWERYDKRPKALLAKLSKDLLLV